MKSYEIENCAIFFAILLVLRLVFAAAAANELAEFGEISIIRRRA
jgi:hypothetical protein